MSDYEEAEREKAQQEAYDLRMASMPARHPGRAAYHEVYLMAWKTRLTGEGRAPDKELAEFIHEVATLAADHYKLPSVAGELADDGHELFPGGYAQ